MGEEVIKLTCNGVKLEKETIDGDKEYLLAPGLINTREPSEKSVVRIATRRSKAEAYFAAMESIWEE